MRSNILHSESDALEESDTAEKRFAARIRRCSDRLVTTGRAAGFWLAVGLPFLYVPLLLSGLEATRHAFLVLGLVLLNLVALVAGRSYGRD